MIRAYPHQESLSIGDPAISIYCDDLIIGGGCSGLSLAIKMGEQFRKRKIVIVENRSVYRRDHTWSFWRKVSDPSLPIPVHCWNSWRVGYQDCETERTSESFQYCSIRADHFWDYCLDQISNLDNVEMITGARLQSSELSALGVDCQANLAGSGQLEIHARRGFDSRLPSLSKSWIKQTFVGKHIHTPSAKFDPSRVTLMEFEHDPTCGILFFYVLPYSSDSALVEVTVISSTVPSREFLNSKLDEYLARIGIADYETEYHEAGLLPMSADVGTNQISKPGLIPIGSARGLARPSSGYAFDEIQRWTREFVAGLNEEGELDKPIPIARPKLITELDRVFLHHIKKDPAGAPSLFMRLFKNTATDVMPRFLQGLPTAGDLIQVIGALPILPLAKSGAEVLLEHRWLRK